MIGQQQGGIRKTLTGLAALPGWWWQHLIKRNPNKWAFGAWFGDRYSDNSRALFEYVLAKRHDIDAAWVTKDADLYKKMKEEGLPVLMVSTHECRHFLKRSSKFFFSTSPFDGDPRCFNGIELINLWHGMPIKKVGADAMGFQRPDTAWKRFKTAGRKLIVPWEFLKFKVVALGEFHVPFLQSAFGIESEDIKVLGSPRTDKFFSAPTEKAITDLRGRFPGAKLIMYMPTFRDSSLASGKAFYPFNEAGFEASRLGEVLERNNLVFLYKGHFYENCSTVLNSSRIITVDDSSYDDMYSFLKDIDILVTDYSSIYFDFLYLRRPIILFPYDLEEYVTDSRPLYFDYSLLEGVRAGNWSELAGILDGKKYTVPSEDTVSRFIKYPDGNCCVRLCTLLP